MSLIQNKIRNTFSITVLALCTCFFFSNCGSSANPSSASGDSTSSSEAIKLGFIPLTDCASLVMAKELGLFEKNGVNVELSKEASWANVRDKLLSGELEGAHCLFGMPFSVYIALMLHPKMDGCCLDLCTSPSCGSTSNALSICE